MKKIVSLILALVLAISALPAVSPAAFAATYSWPDLSKGYLEMVLFGASGTIPVFSDPDLKIPGTLEPLLHYNSHLDAGDSLKIYSINKISTKVKFPTKNGDRVGYVSTKTLFGVSSPVGTFTAKASVNVKNINKSITHFGSTEVGDTIIPCATAKNGYTLILYTAVKKDSGRIMKAGFVSGEDLSKLQNGTSSTQSAQTQNMSYALYKSSDGYLSCNFDGYSKQKGRHEGIDFAKSIGSPIYSLTSGVITRVVEGYRGGDGLSTIAIFSEELGKTVIYLHCDPLDTLKVGQYVERGTKIGNEDWRGVSKSKDAHSHVEVRNGRQTHAAKSVNDSKLDNQNPKAFWESLGYKVK